MNKTITINLGGLVFNIDEQAYARLAAYLESIKAHFSSLDGSGEIVRDIEARMAEQFLAKITRSKQVITDDDVAELIGVMGTVEDIDDVRSGEKESEKEQKDEKTPPASPKKLMRSSDDVVIGGVCSGLAAFFGIDPVIVRLLFFASIFFGGSGIIIYLVLWAILPQAKTAADRIEMRGEPVTLSGIEEFVKDKIRDPEKSDKIRAASNRLADAAAKTANAFILILKNLVRAVFAIAGFALIICGALGISAVIFGLVNLYAGTGIFQSIEPLKTLMGGSFNFAAISLFVAVFIPLIFIIQLGASLISNRVEFKLMPTIAWFVIWMLAVSILASFALTNLTRSRGEQSLKKSLPFDLQDPEFLIKR